MECTPRGIRIPESEQHLYIGYRRIKFDGERRQNICMPERDGELFFLPVIDCTVGR